MKDTIDMAREAGIDAWWNSGSDWREKFDEHLKDFEALVRADERKQIKEENQRCYVVKGNTLLKLYVLFKTALIIYIK